MGCREERRGEKRRGEKRRGEERRGGDRCFRHRRSVSCLSLRASESRRAEDLIKPTAKQRTPDPQRSVSPCQLLRSSQQRGVLGEAARFTSVLASLWVVVKSPPTLIRQKEAEMAFLWRLLLTFALLARTELVFGCVCPAATVLSQFPSEVPAQVCCLNFSGSTFSHVHWSVLTNETSLETLDLSGCNISSIDSDASEASPALQRVYLGQNRLASLPSEFLSGQSSLVEVDLSGNKLQELPENFLHRADSLQKLFLHGNQLRFLPGSILQKPSLQRLELEGNPWDCSCALLEGFEAGKSTNRTARLQDLVGNLTCFSPRHLAGRTLWSVRLNDVCRPAALTALFIVLPLIILSALLLCWCCGRKRRKKEVPMLSTSKKRASSTSSNGQKYFIKQLPSAAEQSKAGDSVKEGILKNQLLLRPASTLLGSTRDIYEEVEVKLGSVESLPRASSRRSSSTEGRQDPQEPDGISKTELDAVSVTEVMKDSADREKAYLTQSTEYYSLVPGIELEDSDHGEYEDVDLS